MLSCRGVKLGSVSYEHWVYSNNYIRINKNNKYNKLLWVSNKQKTSNNETKWDKSSKLKIEMGPTKLVWVSSAVIK